VYSTDHIEKTEQAASIVCPHQKSGTSDASTRQATIF